MCNFYFGGRGAAQSFKFLFVDGLIKLSHCKKKQALGCITTNQTN
jgi:hypothetical protein